MPPAEVPAAGRATSRLRVAGPGRDLHSAETTGDQLQKAAAFAICEAV